VAAEDGARHDPVRLAAAYRELFDGGVNRWGAFMAMTAWLKDELSRVPVTKPCCRKAEVSTLLRFAGGLTLSAGTS